ncbi:LTA synthase family protein [Ruminiclostridium cellulolyticum]|uniref:Sulfatase n=1 Tax=Ruminiclostridium cellulolyticum (strain ATCC 35319 / DSM 5812 / JCM 6584 / H10) TaxID=394503 RepID=B8I5T9_RUMCH|nr:LTA synthase family protein [Ruminiclostridium cellulolyticum]ACL74756.1 sulfatase [Ruminiclostridium cellulolyticum H10]
MLGKPSYGIVMVNRRRLGRKTGLVNYLAQEWMAILTLAVLLFKSIVLMGFVYSPDKSVIDITRGFNNIRYMSVCVAFLIIIVSFNYLAKGKGRLWLLLILNFLCSFLYVFDAVYLRANGNFLSTQLLRQTGNVNNLWGSIFAMFRPCDIVFFIDIPILVAILIITRKMYYSSPLFTSMKTRLIAFGSLFAMSVAFIIGSYIVIDVYGNNKYAYIFHTYWKPEATICNASPLGYHLYDCYVFFADFRPYEISEKERTEIQKWIDDKKENLPDNSYKGMYQGKNLLVLQVESLENFVIGQSVNGQEITPILNKLLKNSIYFDNYYTQVNEGTSSDAELMTNTSVFPVRKGSTFFRFPYTEYNSLPKIMGKYGYSTKAIHPDDGAYWNWKEALTNMGFQQCIDSKSFKMDEIIFLGLSDGSYFRQIKDTIIQQKQPFYNFMITLTSHSPFEMPKEHQYLNLDSYLENTRLGGYFQSINYTDRYIGTFLDELDKAGILDNTVVAIYGDHDSVHKYFDDQIREIKPSQSWWLENDKKIPLILYEKGQTPQVIHTTGGQIDLMSTLLYSFGIEKSEYESTSFGRNLLNTQQDYVLLADGEFRGNIDKAKQKELLDGLEYADMAIKTNFFKK